MEDDKKDIRARGGHGEDMRVRTDRKRQEKWEDDREGIRDHHCERATFREMEWRMLG